jgi:hypothetical protein
VGFLDRAKKLAEQAKEKAEQAKDKAEEALADVRARSTAPDQPAPPAAPGAPTTGATSGQPTTGGVATSGPGGPPTGSPATSAAGNSGTPYVPGMLGRPGWRERGLDDPAALLPINERNRVGVPRSTKSQIVEEPFGMGRRWSSGDRSTALFYQLYPDHQSWEPPGGKAPLAAVSHASTATLPDGRALVFLGDKSKPVVFEAAGLDDTAIAELTQIVADHLTSS